MILVRPLSICNTLRIIEQLASIIHQNTNVNMYAKTRNYLINKLFVYLNIHIISVHVIFMRE